MAVGEASRYPKASEPRTEFQPFSAKGTSRFAGLFTGAKV